jgi:hypothetical protein
LFLVIFSADVSSRGQIFAKPRILGHVLGARALTPYMLADTTRALFSAGGELRRSVRPFRLDAAESLALSESFALSD